MSPRIGNKPGLAHAAPTRVRPRRDFEAMKERLRQAADLLRRGVIPAEIARRLGVSHQVVSEWRKVWLAPRSFSATREQELWGGYV